MASRSRINSVTAKVLMVIWLTVAIVPSEPKPSEEASSMKPNSWIIQSPVKRPLPGLTGIGLPPGGVLLMTMEPNDTMIETQSLQQQYSFSNTTHLPSVVTTEVSLVSQSPMTSTDVEEVAVTDTLSTSSIGTEAISEASNSPTLELETVTQEILSEEIELPSTQTPTTEEVTDAEAIVKNQDLNAAPQLEALMVVSEISQTTLESIELTTTKEDVTTGSPTTFSEDGSIPLEPNHETHLIGEDQEQIDVNDLTLITTTVEVPISDVVNDEDVTSEPEATTVSESTEYFVPHSSEPTVDNHDATTTEPYPTISDEVATTEVEPAVPTTLSELLESSTESGSVVDETSTDAGSGAILSIQFGDEVDAQSGSGASPDDGSDAPPDVAADDSVLIDSEATTDSSSSETESPAVTEVVGTEAHEFLVVTTEIISEDPGLGDAVTEIENIDLGLDSNSDGGSLVVPAATKNAGNSRSLLSNVNEDDGTQIDGNVVEDLTKSGDEEARQYRPYPIRQGMRPGGRPKFRPSIDRHDQNFRPEYEDNDFSVLSRTYDYCYTMWCKFKTTLSRIGLL